jgi:AraC family transcriptional regulator
MSLSRHTAHCSETLAVHIVYCRPHDDACGPDECVPVNCIAFPLRGTFVKHHSRRERVVADACHAIFFKAGEPYRVSHPVAGGDECLVIEPSREVMEDIVGAHEFRRTHALLDARQILAPRLLRHRLSLRITSSLEVDETAQQLFAAVVDAAPSVAARSRQNDIVEATQVLLAAHPGESWSLAALARRVYSSPFHLARTFRRLVGVSLHRYLLQARLAASLIEILDSSRELSAIAMDLGFSSHSHFTAAFRSTFGTTPAAMRKQGKILTAARGLLP